MVTRTDNRASSHPDPRGLSTAASRTSRSDRSDRANDRSATTPVAAEQEDFAGFVHLRLIEDDYAILRKFQKRSSLRTYLAAVIERLSLDFCVEKWGRWRPSAMAERLGPVAIVLERLVTRDGHTLEEAIEIISTDHAAADLSPASSATSGQQLPPRVRDIGGRRGGRRDRAVGPDGGSGHRGRRAPSEHRATRNAHCRAAFDRLPAQDRVMIALRFDQDLSIVEIAQLTGSLRADASSAARQKREAIAAAL